MNTWKFWEDSMPGEGIQVSRPFAHTLPYPSLPSGCSRVVFLYKKSVILSKIILRVPWAILANYMRQGSWETPNFMAGKSEVELPRLGIDIWSGGRLVVLWGLCQLWVVSVRIELNCSPPSGCPESGKIGWYEEIKLYTLGVRSVLWIETDQNSST